MKNLIQKQYKSDKDKKKAEQKQKIKRQKYEIQQQIDDDEQDGMISNRPKYKKINTQSPQKKQNQKLYYVLNPNIKQQDEQENEFKLIKWKQLNLKSLIVFLTLLLFLMFGAYKIIREVYDIQHPQEIMKNKLNQIQLNMNQKSIKQKQQIKVQERSTLAQDKNTLTQNKGIFTQDYLINTNSDSNKQSINPLQATQKRYEQKFGQKGINNIQNPIHSTVQNKANNQNTLKQEHNAQNMQTYHINSQNKNIQKQSDQNTEKLQRQKEQDIEALQKENSVPLLNNQQIINNQPSIVNNQQKSNKQQINQQKIENPQFDSPNKPKNSINPTIQNSQKYLWNNPDKYNPIAKANITRQQALKWRGYVKMIQIPLSTPIQQNPLLSEQYNYYEQKYNISQYAQLPICVVIPTYNNAQNSRYKMNIQSIIQQNYSNYHVVVIDDKSDDKTGQLIEEYLSSFQPKYKQKVKIIINQERKMAMPNLRYAAMNQCQQNQLFIIVDGDDALIGRQVFKLFSAVMQKRNLWVMWTNFLSPKGSIGYSRQYSKLHRSSNNYRKAGFVMSHLRAYYTKLFRLIKQEDLKNENGEYYHAANDVAIGIPILEMAHQHTSYVPQINYFYNMNTGLNNHRVRLKQQKNNDKKIRKKNKYEALPSLGFNQNPISSGSTNSLSNNLLNNNQQTLKLQENLNTGLPNN